MNHIEMLKNVYNLNLAQLEKNSRVDLDDIDGCEGENDSGGIMAEGGKMLKGRGDLFCELADRVEIFHSGDFNKVRNDSGGVFPKDSGWKMSVENEGQVFGGNIKDRGTFKTLDFESNVLLCDSFRISKLTMVGEISEGRKWADDLNLGDKMTVMRVIASQVECVEKDFDGNKAVGEKIGLGHGGLVFPGILSLHFFMSNFGNNSGVDLDLLPVFVRENSLKKMKKA